MKIKASDDINMSICNDDNYEDRVTEAINVLQNDKQLTCLNLLGRGSYGQVYQMLEQSSGTKIAVKIVPQEIASNNEICMWPKIHHPNIIQLLGIFHLPTPRMMIFIMPMQINTLQKAAQDRYFLNQKAAMNYLKSWLTEILAALDYLHSCQACHMDLKCDNVLISNKYSALICDFTFLNSTLKKLESTDIGLPFIYKPPEAFVSLDDNRFIDGCKVDIWGFGVMTVEVLTDFGLSKAATNFEKSDDIYKTLNDMSQEEVFHSTLCSTFPESGINLHQTRLAIDFIQGCLMFDPSQRVSAATALSHPFLLKDATFQNADDPKEESDKNILHDKTSNKSEKLLSKVEDLEKKVQDFDKEVKNLSLKVDGLIENMEELKNDFLKIKSITEHHPDAMAERGTRVVKKKVKRVGCTGACMRWIRKKFMSCLEMCCFGKTDPDE